MSIHQFSAATADGSNQALDAYSDRVVLVVNVASKCGLTPQYEGLEALYQENRERGLQILGFPCNQFGAQEPGTEDEIAAFCERNYGVDFLLTEKVNVNGPDAHPVFAYLTAALPGVLGSRAIKWNFTKFLVGKDGQVIKRYAPTDKPESLQADIDKVFGIFPRLKERRDQAAATMSGGERQMLAIGRALMANPSLILLDEPTEGLAPVIVDHESPPESVRRRIGRRKLDIPSSRRRGAYDPYRSRSRSKTP